MKLKTVQYRMNHSGFIKLNFAVSKVDHIIYMAKEQGFSEGAARRTALDIVDSNKTHHQSIAVIFEVIPNDRKKQDYLDIASRLKPELEKIDGFISIERFQSLSDPEKILSLSFWRDEKSILTWRSLELHRQAQNNGRNGIFKDYHLRIAHVARDYGMFDRREAPTDSKTYHSSSDH